MKMKLTRQELEWIVYDIGNSAFILLVSTILPIYFNSLSTAAGLSEATYLSYWSYATSVSTLVVAFLGPILGTVADFEGNKKKVFMGSAFLGALALACFWIPSGWLSFLVLYAAGKVCYSLSLVVYDSMLTDVTTAERMDNVSAKGYAWGYIGSVIPFLMALVLVLLYDKIGITLQTAMAAAFIINAIWWFAFTLPLLKGYKQKYSVPLAKGLIVQSFERILYTLKDLKNHKKILFFLLAFFFYIDGVYTIIDMATAYGTSLGLDTTGLLLALLLTQVVAFPASLTFAYLSKKYDTGRLIRICIIAYFLIACFAVQLDKLWEFWFLAFAVGCFQGGIQALSRSYFAKIIPENKSGEFFGIFDICGKGASFLGLLVVGTVTQATGNQSFAVACLSTFFLIGLFFFIKTERTPADNK